MHKVLHEYYFATIGRTEEEGERVRKELEKKREDIVSLLEKEKQVSRETLCEDLRKILDATLTSDEYDARILWFGKPENPKRLLLPGVGLKFEELFVHELPHYRDVFLKTKRFGWSISDPSAIYPDSVDKHLAELLFLMKGGLTLQGTRRPVKIVCASDKKIREKFIRLIVSLINIDYTSDFAEKYAGRRELQNFVKRWQHIQDHNLEKHAKMFNEALEIFSMRVERKKGVLDWHNFM